MDSMIEKERKGFRKISGKLGDWNRNRIAEKKRIHDKEEKFKKQLEDKYIKQRMEKKLKLKYANPTFGWSLPKTGERSAGMGILEGLSGTGTKPGKKKKHQLFI